MPERKRDRRALRTAALFVLAYGIALGASRAGAYVPQVIWRELRDDPWILESVETLYRMVSSVGGRSYDATLAVATVLATLGFVARRLARGRVLAGLPDPLEGVRRFVAGHKAAAAGLVVAPALAWSAILAAWLFRHFHFGVAYDNGRVWLGVAGFVVPASLAFAAQGLLARRGLRALLAPTTDAQAATDAEVQADGFTFDAVAVTLETRAAVAAMAALPFAFFAALSLAGARHGNTVDLAAIAAYVAATAGATLLFRRASRIAVGVDGILVKGSSRRRFYAFRDVDGVRARGTDIELYRGKRTLLRLQLHGDDAARREALVARIGAAIARAHSDRDDAVASFVRGASTSELAHAAGGGADYRRAAVSREQLWSVLEGPASDVASRQAAACALATGADDESRVRLRIALERSAEPAVRASLEEVLDAERKAEAEAALPPLRRALTAWRE